MLLLASTLENVGMCVCGRGRVVERGEKKIERCIERALIISLCVCPCIRGEVPDVVDMMVPWGP